MYTLTISYMKSNTCTIILKILFKSLKKEADWDRSDDKESSSDYRHSHGDMVSYETFLILFYNFLTERTKKMNKIVILYFT